MFFQEDTIAAIATPAGVGAISIIRISGCDSFRAIDAIFSGKSPIQQSTSHTIHYGKIFSNEGELIDDVLVSVFRSPHSYTGEDCIEINTHGNPLISEKVLQRVIAQGVRLAEPGEFTKRAFLNNRLDLSQAEAVIEVIKARTDASLRGARNQLDGLLSAKIKDLRTMLINSSSLIELELDFSEEDIEFIDRTELTKRIINIISEIESLLQTYSFGRVIRDGVNVALVGQPNVGKSSLLNYLLKESRAIVSETPGTTRDIIREEVSIDGILFRLFDTAGIRSTDDKIEIEGVSRSRGVIMDADLVVFIFDPIQDVSRETYQEVRNLSDEKKIIKVMNKCDLKHESLFLPDLKVSALTGEGIPELLSMLKAKATGGNTYTEKTAIVSNVRHFENLNRSKDALLATLKSIESNMSGEFISIDLREAESSLSEIIGLVTSEDILNNIFEKFCIGK